MTYRNNAGAGALTNGSSCGCGSSSCWSGGTGSLERTRYFPRQLITPDDLTAEQDYFRAKSRRHNRLLHGWGVVCGCKVTEAPAAKGQNTPPDWTIQIEPGYVLGPQGDEILIDETITVDLSKQGLDGNAATPCGDDTDPWCSSVRVDRRVGEVVYIAVAYTECLTRPVRVQAAGCGCDGSACEYSRIRDSFVVRVLTTLPDSYRNRQAPVSPFECPPSGEVRPCPECVDDPWVILATVNLSSKTIRDSDIDNATYRRYVASFGNWWFTCAGPAPSPSPTPTPTPTPTPPPTTAPLLKVNAVRILSAQERVLFEMTDPAADIFLQAESEPAIIEVVFGPAQVNFDSIVLDQTFRVDGNHTPPSQEIERRPGNTVRWRCGGIPEGDYRVTLVGDGDPAIESQQNRALDGEPRQLPSGNNQPGGDFVFRFSVRFQ